MGKQHLIGMLVGAGSIAISKTFWTTLCYSVAETYISLETSTCDSFKTFFFYFGIITMTLSFIGLIRNK